MKQTRIEGKARERLQLKLAVLDRVQSREARSDLLRIIRDQNAGRLRDWPGEMPVAEPEQDDRDERQRSFHNVAALCRAALVHSRFDATSPCRHRR